MIYLKKTCFLAIITSLSLTGCYSYQPLPNAIKSNNYTTLVKDEKLDLPDDIDLLTVQKAQELAVKNNPNLIATKHAMSAAYAVFYQSLSSYLPTSNGYYNVGATNTYPDKYTGPGMKGPKTHEYYHSVGMNNQYLIFDGLKRTMDMLATYNTAEASEDALKDAHRLLRQSVTVAYITILLSKENISIAQADLDFNLQLLNDTEIKYNAGAKALIDVLNFRINATQSKNFLIEFQYSLKAAKYALAKLLGLTSADIPPQVKFEEMEKAEVVLLTDLSFYLDKALVDRPDLAEYRHRLNVVNYNLYSAWGNFSPKVYFNNTLDHSQTRTRIKSYPRQTTAHQRRDFLNYGGTVEWSLFEGGKRFAQVREAQALVAAQEFNVAQKWIEVIKEVRLAYDECLKNTELLMLFRKIQSDSRKYRDLVEENYKAGNAPITELNQAQSELTKNEAQLVSARINILNAKAQLAAAVGAFSTISDVDAIGAEETDDAEEAEDVAE